ncbi:MAG: cyanophycin synthetase, partial [Bacteroidales bacterium]
MTIEVLAKQGNGVHHGTMAESILTRVYDLRKKVIQDSFQNFQQQEHRLEFVAKIRGVEFINDSMACNINSAWYALENMHNPTIWIVGGQMKDAHFDMLKPLVKKKVKAIICLGVDNTPLIDAFAEIIPNFIQTRS